LRFSELKSAWSDPETRGLARIVNQHLPERFHPMIRHHVGVYPCSVRKIEAINLMAEVVSVSINSADTET
jgi:hypothetical protein